MLSLAATLLALAGVAFASAPGPDRGDRAGALLCALAALAVAVREQGGLSGALVFAVLAMAAASALVLVLAPRPALARPMARAAAVAGALSLLGGLA